MITSHEDCERIASIAKRLLAERRQYERRAAGRDKAITPKQITRLNTDLNWQAMEIVKVEHELHVACVDAGLADLREASHYGPRDFHPSGWHHYRWEPVKPRALA